MDPMKLFDWGGIGALQSGVQGISDQIAPVQRNYRGRVYYANSTGPGYFYNGKQFTSDPELRAAIDQEFPAPTPPSPNAPSAADTAGAKNTFSQYLASLGQGPDTASLNKELSGSFNLLDQSQARDLGMLRDVLGQQQQSNVQDLRANLAQRGLLDSGSLGAGVTNIGNEISQQLARGYSASAGRKESQEADMIQTALNRNLDRQKAVATLSQNAWDMLSKLGLSYDQLNQSDKQFLNELSLKRDSLNQEASQFQQQLSFNKDKAEKDREAQEWEAFWGGLTGLAGGGLGQGAGKLIGQAANGPVT